MNELAHIYPLPDALPQLLEDANRLQAALNNAQQLASMLPRALSQQEALTVKAAVSGSSEDRQRLEVAVHEVRMATDAKNTVELLKAKLAANAQAVEAARSRERAQESEDLRKLFEQKYIGYKESCTTVKMRMKELLYMNAKYREMTGRDMPNWGESRERWLNLPAIAGQHDDVTMYSTGTML